MGTKKFNVATYLKLKISFDVAIEILRSRHINKLNIDKQGCDRLFKLLQRFQHREEKSGRDITN